MFGGLGQYAFSIDMIAKETGELKILSGSLNQLLLNRLDYSIKYLRKKPVIFDFYDVISGVSGSTYYLLDFKNVIGIKENKSKLLNLLKFLAGYATEYSYCGKQVIRFHIQKDQQYLTEERRDMPDGHINFGMAHGMMGPLIALAKAKFLGFQFEGLEKGILKIFSLYENYAVREDEMLKYPKKLPFEDYILGKSSNLLINSGWCYGNISIVRGMMKVSYYMKWKEKYEFYKKELLGIINQPVEAYNLQAPIVCHGYGSIVTVQCAAYKATNDERFLYNLERNLKILLEKHKEQDKTYFDDVSLLNGAGGVILTLLGSITGNASFSRILLMD